MKVRIANNSIRFRLRQPEVQLFLEQRSIAEVLEFGVEPNDQIRFVLKAMDDDQFFISFRDHAVVLQIPHQLVQEWIVTDLVGFEEKIQTSKGKTINVLVEKDFACLDKTVEENEGTYPNPKANC